MKCLQFLDDKKPVKMKNTHAVWFSEVSFLQVSLLYFFILYFSGYKFSETVKASSSVQANNSEEVANISFCGFLLLKCFS